MAGSINFSKAHQTNAQQNAVNQRLPQAQQSSSAPESPSQAQQSPSISSAASSLENIKKIQDIQHAAFDPSGALDFNQPIGMPAPAWVNALDDAEKLIAHQVSQKESNAKNLPTGNQYFYHQLEQQLNADLGNMDASNLSAFTEQLKARQQNASPDVVNFINQLLENAERYFFKE